MEWIVEAETLEELVEGRFVADTKPLIRCRDCKYYRKERAWNCVEYMVCELPAYYKPTRQDDDFCSRAERKET